DPASAPRARGCRPAVDRRERSPRRAPTGRTGLPIGRVVAATGACRKPHRARPCDILSCRRRILATPKRSDTTRARLSPAWPETVCSGDRIDLHRRRGPGRMPRSLAVERYAGSATLYKKHAFRLAAGLLLLPLAALAAPTDEPANPLRT